MRLRKWTHMLGCGWPWGKTSCIVKSHLQSGWHGSASLVRALQQPRSDWCNFWERPLVIFLDWMLWLLYRSCCFIYDSLWGRPQVHVWHPLGKAAGTRVTPRGEGCRCDSLWGRSQVHVWHPVEQAAGPCVTPCEESHKYMWIKF